MLLYKSVTDTETVVKNIPFTLSEIIYFQELPTFLVHNLSNIKNKLIFNHHHVSLFKQSYFFLEGEEICRSCPT